MTTLRISIAELTDKPEFQAEFHQIGNGDDWIESGEVDQNGDGYLDCELYQNARQFMHWQNVFFQHGLISKLYGIPSCHEQDGETDLEFDYLQLEDGRLMAYFDERKDARLFCAFHSYSESKVKAVSAVDIERQADMPRDVVDAARPVEVNFFQDVDDVNRPESGQSDDGLYWALDVTSILEVPESALEKLNQRGENSANCFYYALHTVGLRDEERLIPEFSVLDSLNGAEDLEYTTEESPGDVVVWYHHNPIGGLDVVHAFIDLGYGWALTKNGKSDSQPYRLMRIDHMRHLYENLADNQKQIAKEMDSYHPRHHEWQDEYFTMRAGAGMVFRPEDKYDYSPLLERRYRKI